MKNTQAITIWVDESTEITIEDKEYNLVGYLITNSDKEEFDFLNSLKQARKENPSCWTTMHCCEIGEKDTRNMALLDRWVDIFTKNENVYFHVFLYQKEEGYISDGKGYENYFAKQSIFSLANKMRPTGISINTMFKSISTLTILFDRRRSHSASIIKKENSEFEITRMNDLEILYTDEISEQIKKISSKDSKTSDFTIRFSFLSSECFDAMQLSDCLLGLVRNKIQQENNGKENKFTKLFDKYFLSNIDDSLKSLSFRKIYEYDKKFNFFESKNKILIDNNVDNKIKIRNLNIKIQPETTLNKIKELKELLINNNDPVNGNFNVSFILKSKILPTKFRIKLTDDLAQEIKNILNK